MILNILKFPNSILKSKSQKVKKVTNKIKNIIKNMSDTMYQNDGLGLAAIQIGIKKNIFLINISNENQILTIINPKIILYKETTQYKEGCLSFPGIFLDIKRRKIIKIKFMSINNKYRSIKIDNLLSICMQHEIDHLNGITLYDKVSDIKKSLILKKTKWEI